MPTKKFIIKTILKIVIYGIMSTIALTFLLENPIITNAIAMEQMKPSDELYLLMVMFIKSKQFISMVYGWLTAIFVGIVIYDIYNFIKTNKNKSQIAYFVKHFIIIFSFRQRIFYSVYKNLFILFVNPFSVCRRT